MWTKVTCSCQGQREVSHWSFRLETRAQEPDLGEGEDLVSTFTESFAVDG